MKRGSNVVIGSLFMLIYMLLGVFLIINPEPSDKIICGVIAGVLGVVGVVRVINYFKMDRYEAMLRKELAIGLFLLLIAFYVIMQAATVISTLIPVALGVILVYEAMGLLQYAVDLMRSKIKYWIIDLIAGVVILTLGIIALFDPFDAQLTLMRFIGISFVVAGVASLVSLFLLRLFKKEYQKQEVLEIDKK